MIEPHSVIKQVVSYSIELRLRKKLKLNKNLLFKYNSMARASTIILIVP